MPASNLDIIIEQGADFSLAMTMRDENGNPLDLTGATFAASIRTDWTAPSIPAEFTAAILTPPTDGKISLSLSAEDALNLVEDAYQYDLLMTKGSVRSRLIQGRISISHAITRIS